MEMKYTEVQFSVKIRLYDVDCDGLVESADDLKDFVINALDKCGYAPTDVIEISRTEGTEVM